jgi:phospholipid/cholesterol/gamma-HCH transport system substrate-binding protein
MLMKISQTTTNLNAAVSDVRRLVLTEDKLKSLGGSLERLTTMTSEAEATMQQLRLLVSNNAAPVSAAVSNLNLFTTQLPPLADYVHSIVATNETSLNSALRNLEAASVSLTNVLSDLENGQGVAGRLLRDETLAANLSAIAQNLSTTTSNLNTRGLWGIMWKQKLPPAPKTNAPAKSK